MTSSKNWALYASKHRVGTFREHQSAGARLGRLGVRLGFTLPDGWRAAVDIGRVALLVRVGPASDDQRLLAFWDHVREDMDKSVEEGLNDFAAGRYYMGLDHASPSRPSPTWRPDDEQQPDGWHHDGTQWVMNETGWAQDRWGFWRYTHPGDVGWVRKTDGSWKYLLADGTPR